MDATECIEALRAKNHGNLYLLGDEKEFADRFKHLISAGFSFDEIAEMKPVPLKMGYVGWIVPGRYAEEVAQDCGLKINVYHGAKRAVIGPPKLYGAAHNVGVKSKLGKTIEEVGKRLAEYGYAAYIF